MELDTDTKVQGLCALLIEKKVITVSELSDVFKATMLYNQKKELR